MDTRLGVLLLGSLLVATGACASSGGSTEGSTSAAVLAGAEDLPQGELPRETAETETAADALEDAESAQADGDEATARPLFEAAITASSTAIAADSTNPLPWLQGGRANIGLGNYEAADSMLARAAELRPLYQFEIDPLREEVWIELYEEAVPLVNSGQYAESAVLLEDANAIYRERPEVMLILGKIYAQEGRSDEAVETLRQAMQIVNSDLAERMDSVTVANWEAQASDVPVLIAQSLINGGRYEEAAAELRALLEEDPGNVIYQRSLASIYVQLEMPDAALAVYDEMMAAEGLTQSDYYQAGLGLYQIELFDRAAEVFRQASDLADYDRDAAEMWARSLQAGHPPASPEDTTSAAVLEELAEATNRWLELDTLSQNALLILAQTENRLGNADRARELIARVDALPVSMDELQLQKLPNGGGAVTGAIRNKTAEPGSTITVQITFYGPGDVVLDTGSVSVQLPPQDATQVFQIPLETDQEIMGYTYTLTGI